MELVEQNVVERDSVKASAIKLWCSIKGQLGLPDVSTRLPHTRGLATVYGNLRQFYLDRGFCKETDFPANPPFSKGLRSRNKDDDIEPAKAGKEQVSVVHGFAASSNPETSQGTAIELPQFMAVQEHAVPELIEHGNVQMPQEQKSKPAVQKVTQDLAMSSLNAKNNDDVLQEKVTTALIPNATQSPAEPFLTDDSSIRPLQGKETKSSTSGSTPEPAVSSLIVRLKAPFQPSPDGKKRKQHSPQDKGRQTKSAKLSRMPQSQAIDNDDQGLGVNTKKYVVRCCWPLNVPHAGQWLQILDETASLYYEMHSKVLEGPVDSFDIVKDGLKSPRGMQMGDWESLIYLYSSRYRSVSERIKMNLADAWVFDFVNVEAAMRAKKEGISIKEAGRNTWDEFFKQRASPHSPEERTATRLDELQEFYKILTTLRHLECEYILAYRVDQIALCLKSFGGKEAAHIFYEWDQALREHLQPL
ncbi:MAG: hypothetical protein Q9214_001458 [Letrouitia sp. 1 TL-2023]